jgi:hypothetical protein
MPPSRALGLSLAVAGLALGLAGLAIAAGGFSWLGRLPGDIRIQREHVQIFIPITTMIVISIVLSALSILLGRLFGGR